MPHHYRHLFTALLVFTAVTLSTGGCTVPERQAAATVISIVSAVSCELVPVFDTSSDGEFVGTICSNLSKAVVSALEARPAPPPRLLAIATPCGTLSEVRRGPEILGYVCAKYATLVEQAAQ